MPDDVWAATSVTNGSSLITAKGMKSPNKAIERIKSVLGNNTLPLPVGPLDFSIPIPKPDPLTLVALSIAGVSQPPPKPTFPLRIRASVYKKG